MQFAIWVERAEVPERVVDLFANEAGAFGLFPYVALGGETGIDGGCTLCATLPDDSVLIPRAKSRK